jgi:hypothetical protein
MQYVSSDDIFIIFGMIATFILLRSAIKWLNGDYDEE